MRRTTFGLAQAAVCGLVMGLTLFVCFWLARPGSVRAAGSVPGVVRAKAFQVVDDSGKQRAAFW